MTRDELEGGLADWLQELGYTAEPYEYGTKPWLWCAIIIQERWLLTLYLVNCDLTLWRIEPQFIHPLQGTRPLLSVNLAQSDAFERIEKTIEAELARAQKEPPSTASE
jgi:hypothetical protein